MSFLVLNLEDKGSRSKSTVLKEIGKYCLEHLGLRLHPGTHRSTSEIWHHLRLLAMQTMKDPAQVSLEFILMWVCPVVLPATARAKSTFMGKTRNSPSLTSSLAIND